jgi:hypothetical protein
MSEHYSDEQIDAEIARVEEHRHFGVPTDIIEWLPAHSAVAIAIIRQLRAERDEARRAAESMRLEVDDCGRTAGLLAQRVLELQEALKTKGDYRQSRGVLPWTPGDEPAEASIRRLRDNEPPGTGTDSRMFATDEAEYFLRFSEGE